MIHAPGHGQDVAHRALEDLDGILPGLRRWFAQKPLEFGARRAAPGHVVPQALESRQQAVRRRIRQLTHRRGRQAEVGAIVIRAVVHVIETLFDGKREITTRIRIPRLLSFESMEAGMIVEKPRPSAGVSPTEAKVRLVSEETFGAATSQVSGSMTRS